MGLQNNLEHNMIKLKKYQNQKLHKTGNKPTSNGFLEKWHLWEIFKKWQNNKCNAITEGQVISSVLASADKTTIYTYGKTESNVVFDLILRKQNNTI